MLTNKNKKPRRKIAKKSNKKSTKKYYFTEETEKAIVGYCATEDLSIRTKLYIEQIQPAFNELVDKIVYTYKFTSLQNIDVHKDDCKIWLTTILGKFNPDKGAKAFSYFSVVTKNWFTHKAKKQSLKSRREIQYDSMIKEVEATTAVGIKTIVEEREEQEYWQFLLKEVSNWQKEIFNKKAIYLYMREITGLNTKQIVSCLKKMREKYATFKTKWDRGEIN